MEPIFNQGVGYGIILGLGAFFALMMLGVTYLQNKFSRHKTNKIDEFAASSRNIPIGLMIVSIVSSWTWSLTLLQLATQSYNMGISGLYFYGIGGLIQVSVFSIVAAKVKANANLVTTFPEMAYFRFGTWGHLSFLFCGLVCNTIVSSCILLGGGVVFNAVTGMNIFAAYFLIPFVCSIYVFFGGLRATFISDASHTFILLIFLIIFAFCIYAGGLSKIGSPSKMYDLLTELGHIEPIDNNYHGLYLTFRSESGGIFLFMSILTGFGLVCLDQAYWSRAVALTSLTTSKAYFIGACAWFIIPVSMGLILGLGARACSMYPEWVPLTDEEVSAGLSAVAAASFLLGRAGSVLILLMVFLSVISSFSGELIATLTLVSYDVYKKYIDKKASPQRVLLVSQVVVFAWGIFAAIIATIFNRIGITLGWLFYFLGTSTCSLVFPVTLTFTWRKLNRVGAVAGSLLGMACAIAVWLIVCKVHMGLINVTNLSNEWVSFSGNITALAMGGIISVGCSLVKPDNFDWDLTRNRTILSENAESSEDQIEESSSEKKTTDEVQHKTLDVESGNNKFESDLPSVEDIQFEKLDSNFKRYLVYCIILAFCASVLFPVPQIAAPYVYLKKFFTFIVVCMFIWLFWTFSMCILLPLWESRKLIYGLLTGNLEEEIAQFNADNNISNE